MTKKNSNIQDVAEFLGVNASTVSRALNPETKGLINPVTVERVLEAARELDYRPNPMACAFRTQQSKTIGIIIPDIMNPVFPPMFRGIHSILENAGYTPIIVNTDNDELLREKSVESLRKNFIDGLILAAVSLEDRLVDMCVEQNLPLVTIHRTVANGAVSAVIIDEKFGISSAFDHLVQLEHSRIAHVAGPLSLSTGRSRYQEFKESIDRHGLNIGEDLIAHTSAFTEEEGFRAFSGLLDSDQDFTAVIAGNDLIALGCLDALEKRGLSCPVNMSVVGYNNMPLMNRVMPPMTTVAVPLSEMGELAARCILEKIKDRDTQIKTITLKPKLVVRQSTAVLNNS